MLKKIFYQYFFVILCAAAIMFLSLFHTGSSVEIPKIKHLDKVVHFIMYAVFSFIWAESFLVQNHFKKRYLQFLFSFLFAFLYSLLMELLQSFTKYRTADIYDAVANFWGAFFGIFIFYFSENKILYILKNRYHRF